MSRDGTEHVNPDGLEQLGDGESVPVDELFAFDDGPYCNLDCAVTEADEDATEDGS
jgi:hypothetical protein